MTVIIGMVDGNVMYFASDSRMTSLYGIVSKRNKIKNSGENLLGGTGIGSICDKACNLFNDTKSYCNDDINEILKENQFDKGFGLIVVNKNGVFDINVSKDGCDVIESDLSVKGSGSVLANIYLSDNDNLHFPAHLRLAGAIDNAIKYEYTCGYPIVLYKNTTKIVYNNRNELKKAFDAYEKLKNN